MRNSVGSSSTSTMSAQQKRRPLHLMTEIETIMMSQKSPNGHNRKPGGAGGVDDDKKAKSAAAFLSSRGGAAEGFDVSRRPRLRRNFKRDDTYNNNDCGGIINDGVCSAAEIGSISSPSTFSFLRNRYHHHRGRASSDDPPSSSRCNVGRLSSSMKKSSFLYGGLFVLCGVINFFWMDGLDQYRHHYTYDLAAASMMTPDQEKHFSNRQLSFLDSVWSDYGKDSFHFEFLLPPSDLDLTVSRRLPIHTHVHPDDTITPDDGLCDDILLFLPDAFANHGHGSQLNSYILAAEVATFLNKSMVLYDAPQRVQKFKGGSQFGCPKDSLVGGESHVLMREQKEGERPKGTRGWVDNFPRGLERLIQHPDWLSRKCSIPCQDDFKYFDWDNVRNSQRVNYTDPETGNKGWKFDAQEVKCQSSTGRDTKVLVVGGYELRKYFELELRDKMTHRVPTSLTGDNIVDSANKDGGSEDKNNNHHAYQWAIRLGASVAEAKAFAELDQENDIWDFVSALMARSGIIRLQPWIARDAEEFIKNADLPLDVDYDSIHVRRGDKLIMESRREVTNFWRARGYGQGTGKKIPRDFIPFSHYVDQGYHKRPCNADGEAHLVYVATDDPRVVKQELSKVKKNNEGHFIMYDCHKFNFVFGPKSENDIGTHLHSEGGHKNCVDRYKRNIAGIADLLILAKSNLFVGEFNSNWGRLVRVFRTRLNEELFMDNGEGKVGQLPQEGQPGGKNRRRRRTTRTVVHPVLIKGLKVAWGKPHPGPLGL